MACSYSGWTCLDERLIDVLDLVRVQSTESAEETSL